MIVSNHGEQKLKKKKKNILQHHNLKVSILWHSAFFMAQLSHPYVTTGKTIALTIQTFVSKVMYFEKKLLIVKE